MKLEDKLKNLKIIVVTHEYATGPSHSLEDFLRTRTESLLFIGHPFVFSKDIRSHYGYYRQKGKLKKESFFPAFFKIQLLSVIKDVLLTIYWVVRHGKFDIYIGVDGLNACVGLFLEKLGFVKKVIFYTIDYIPQRFSQKLLNDIYHWLDRTAVTNCDKVWNLSYRMVVEREKRGLERLFRNKQLVVPVGTEKGVGQVSFSSMKRYYAAHMGHLTAKQGVQTLISALPEIIRKVPGFHLEIIGGGEYEGYLKELARKLKVERYLTFWGFIKNHQEVEKKLARCALAVAPYVDNEANFVRFTDPGKVKAYLAAGLPVVLTKVPDVWREIEAKKAGVAVNDSVNDLAHTIINLLTDGEKLKLLRKNAYKMGKEYAWEKIFTSALAQSI